MNMGIEPFLVATSVNLIQLSASFAASAKTVRKSTPPHRSPGRGRFTPEEANKVKTSKAKVVRVVTIPATRRIGLYEVMEVTDEIRELF